MSSGANEQNVTGKWLKRALWVTWQKSFLPALCCRWTLRPSGRLQVTQDRARDLHKTLMLQGIPPHTALRFTTSCIWAQEPAPVLFPLMCTDRQTGKLGQSQLHKLQRGHKAALGAGDSSWDRDVDPHWRLSHTLVVLAQSSSQGALLPLEGHSKAKFWVPFLCPSSPWESITVQLKNTWQSRAQPHALPFPMGQRSLFKRNYSSAMTGKTHGVWAMPSQWWICNLFRLPAILALCATIPVGTRVPRSCNPLLKNREWRINQFVICFSKKG